MEFRYPFDPATGLPGAGGPAWTNGDPSIGVEGSIPPAESLNDPQREICDAIDFFLGDGEFGSAQDDEDLTQLRQAIRRATGADGTGALLANPGYQVFPSGLILQWGRISTFSGDFVTFPLTFPTTCVAVTCSDSAAALSGRIYSVGRNSNGFTAYIHQLATGGELLVSDELFYMAVGY